MAAARGAEWARRPAAERAAVLVGAAALDAGPPGRAGGAHGLRGRQALARGRRRRGRGHRLLRVLRPARCSASTAAAPSTSAPGEENDTPTSRAASRSSSRRGTSRSPSSPGMATAALVTGNTVIVKPAEQIAGHRRQAGGGARTPPASRPASLNFLPGVGEVVGAAPRAPPGRRRSSPSPGRSTVGLSIIEPRRRDVGRAAAPRQARDRRDGRQERDHRRRRRRPRRGRARRRRASAFGYAGQKCSAGSRAIVLATSTSRSSNGWSARHGAPRARSPARTPPSPSARSSTPTPCPLLQAQRDAARRGRVRAYCRRRRSPTAAGTSGR